MNPNEKKYTGIYLALVGATFFGLAAVFCLFPRSTYSPLEKRELAKFPQYSTKSLQSGELTKGISSWFSDSEPYRDVLMQMSMEFKQLIALSTGEDENAVHFHAATDKPAGADAEEENNGEIGEYKNKITANDNAKVAHAGIIIVGNGPKVRALMAYGGGAKSGGDYARICNKYKETFPNVNVYCMVAPVGTDFYVPDNARSLTKPQRPTIQNVHSLLAPGVKPVDVYTPLGKHAAEDIYLRTDHHWAPLGGFYAAQAFAKVAGVPFRPLSSYERKVVHGYVGSMYGYSKDIAVKNAPEDFVFFEPKDAQYETWYVNYKVNEDYHVCSISQPFKSQFFFHYKDGSGGAYCTFMGGDMRLTRVKTNVKNGRRVMILKDSYGNTLPGYLFYSFEEVHVVDFRYFARNMKKYVAENKITDILFANNIFNVCSPLTYERYMRFLTQPDNQLAPASVPKKDDKKTANGKKDADRKTAPAAKKENTKEKKPAAAEKTAEPAKPAAPAETAGEAGA